MSDRITLDREAADLLTACMQLVSDLIEHVGMQGGRGGTENGYP